jgi:hypothetical protein
LNKLFLSADTTKNINLTTELGIPPVYSVSYASLANDTGSVAMQVFFYGDKDGKNIFEGFQKMFAPSLWKITPSKQWITISSLKGKPVNIYANRPLPEETGEDEKAQKALDSYGKLRRLSFDSRYFKKCTGCTYHRFQADREDGYQPSVL